MRTMGRSWEGQIPFRKFERTDRRNGCGYGYGYGNANGNNSDGTVARDLALLAIEPNQVKKNVMRKNTPITTSYIYGLSVYIQ